MQFQIVLSALLLTSLFALPVQAVEEDESKKRRSSSKLDQGATREKVEQQGASGSQSEQDVEFEGPPAGIYKNLDLNSF